MKLNETYQGKVIFDYDFAEGTTLWCRVYRPNPPKNPELKF